MSATLPNIGEIVTFAGGKYPVQHAWHDTNVIGAPVALVLIGANNGYKGFTIPVESLKEYSPEAIGEAQKAALKDAQTRERLKARLEAAQRRENRPISKSAFGRFAR